MTHTDFDTDTIELSDVSVDDFINSKLVVYNDDHNTFEWVIECFCKYLKHSSEQAEQCAYLVHFSGKCGVKTGSYDELEPLCKRLLEAELSAEIH